MALKLALLISAFDRASPTLERVGNTATRIGEKADRVGRSLRGLGQSAIPRLTLPIAATGGFALRAFGQMEQLETGFTSMLGSAEKAGKLVEDLVKFSARTPFQIPGIGQSARSLLAFGVQQENVLDRLRLLGDIAAGAQVPLQDMVQIYGKGLAQGRIQTEELNQMTDRGIPIYEALIKLADKYGHKITTAQVRQAAEKGQISFKNMHEALELLTAEGGVFHRQMELQSGTLFGLFSIFKDNAFLALTAIGEKIDEVFDVKGKMKRFTEWIGTAVERFQRLAEERPGLVRLGFVLAGVAAIAGPALIALGLMVSGIGFIAGGLGALAGVLGLIFSPIGLFVAAIAGAAWAIYEHWDDVVAFFERTWRGIRGAFPGAAQFFEDLWSGVETPFYEMMGWLRGAWLTLLDWLEGPGNDESVFDWLSRPVVGLFDWIGRQWDAAMRIVSNPRQVWAWLTAGFTGAFAWVERQWNAALAWISAPDTDVWGWLTAGFTGAFAWVERQWNAALAWISAPDTDVWGWLTAGFTGAFAWVERQWNAALAWISEPVTAVWAWLRNPDSGAFKWIESAWATALAGIAAGASIGIALDIPTVEEAAAWAVGALAAITAAIAAIDFKKIGTSIGGAIRDGFLTFMDLFKGDGLSSIRVLNAFVSVLEGLGDLMVAVVRGAFDLVVGMIDGIFATDIEGAVDRLWKSLEEFSLKDVGLGWIDSLEEGINERWRGLASWFERNLGIDIGGGDAVGGRQETAQGGAYDFWPAQPPSPTVFGAGGAIAGGQVGAAATARVGGELRIVIDERGRARVESVRSDNPDVPIEVDRGFSMATSP